VVVPRLKSHGQRRRVGFKRVKGRKGGEGLRGEGGLRWRTDVKMMMRSVWEGEEGRRHPGNRVGSN
jgi:hypothetical protein